MPSNCMPRYRADNMPQITEHQAETPEWRGYRLRRWRHGQFHWSERRSLTIPTRSVHAGYDGDAEGGQLVAFSYAAAPEVPPSPIASLSRMVRRASDTGARAYAIRSLTESSTPQESTWQAAADTLDRSLPGPNMAYHRGLNYRRAIRVVWFRPRVPSRVVAPVDHGTSLAVVAYTPYLSLAWR
jgi:hypothetical protein